MNNQLDIKSLSFNGFGVSKGKSGKVIFVENSAPGDVVEVDIYKDKKNFSFAKIKRLITPSPLRSKPFCKHYQKCGGCNLQHIKYKVQVREKEKILKDELKKNGLTEEISKVFPIKTSNEKYYRTSTRLQIKNNKIGFFAKKSHNFVEVSNCGVLSQELNKKLRELKKIFHEEPSKISGYFEISENQFKEISILLKCDNLPSNSTLRKIKSISSSFAVLRNNRYSFLKKNFPVYSHFLTMPGVFVQKNFYINRILISEIQKILKKIENRNFFVELFSGAGNFTIILSQFFKNGIAFEINDHYKEVVLKNMQVAKNTKFHFLNLYENSFLPFLLNKNGRVKEVDLVVADPPRAGLKKNIDDLLVLEPSNIILISCDPIIFVHNIKKLLNSKKYKIETIIPLDMFPQTHHFEVVGYLKKTIEKKY